MKYLKKSDILITLIILLLDTVLLILFFNSIYAFGSYGTTQKLGTLIFKKKAATRKHVDDLSWNAMKNNTPVYELDTIRTASQSEASIEFEDGSSLGLLENTLIKLKLKDSAEIGDFEKGSFTFSSKNNKKSVTVLGRTIEMNDDSEIIVHKNEDGKNEIEVTRGNIFLSQANGELINVKEAQSLSLSDEKIEIKDIKCMPFYPPHNNRLLTSEDSYNIMFSWSLFSDGSAKNRLSSLIISQDKECKNILAKVEGKVSKEISSLYSASYNTPLGVFYWQVEYDDGKRSAIRKFALDKIAQVKLIKPLNKQMFYYYDQVAPVMFSWNASSSTSYILEVSETMDFSSPKVKMQISSSFIELPNLSEGTYYWRVLPNTNTSKNILGELAIPEVRSFAISKKEVLDEVKLKFPIDGYLCNINVFPISGLSFTWEEKHGVKEYELLLYNSKDDPNPVQVVSSALPFVKLKANETQFFESEGDIYFSVRYKSSKGNISPIADKRCIKKVNYNIDLQTLYPPNQYKISSSLIMNQRFSWKHSMPLKTYFVIAKDEDFKNIVLEKENNIFSITGINLKPDKYYWQIRVYNKDNSIFAKTKVQSFSVVGPLDVPPVLSPIDKTVVPVMEDENLELRWGAVKGADYYEVALYDDQGKKLKFYPFVKDTRLFLPMNYYPQGHYNVCLQAFTLDSQVSTYNIGYKGYSSFESHVLTHVRLKRPATNSKFDGLKVYTSGMKFVYDSKEKYDKLDLVLEKNGVLLKTIGKHDKNNQTIEVSYLTQGEYEWYIKAYVEGFDISSKEKRRFTVSPIPPLPAPVFFEKKMSDKIDVEYLLKNRNIHFEWKPVEDASYYVIQLKSEETGEIIKTISNFKDTSFDFSEFEKLHVGKFIFKVWAISLLGHNNAVRGGNEAIYPFEIALPKLKELEVQDEEYYGY